MEDEEGGASPSTAPLESSDAKSFELLRKDGSADLEYTLGTFQVNSSSPSIPIVLITTIAEQFLVAVPFEAWHRLKAQRLLPPDSLSKATLIDVSAVRELDREVIEDGVTVRVWVRFLKNIFNPCLFFEPARIADHACRFLTESGEEGFVPYAESLVAVADEKFAFLSALKEEEADVPGTKADVPGANSTAERLARLEEGFVSIQSSLQQLLKNTGGSDAKQLTSKDQPQKTTANAKKSPVDGLPGLDAQVVASARAAGVDQKQLEEFSKLIMAEKPKLTDAPRRKGALRAPVNILGESEDEDHVEDAAVAATGDPSDQLSNAIVKLTSIVSALSSKKKSRVLDEFLDDSVAIGEGGSCSSSAGSNRRHSYLMKVLRQALRESPEELYKVIESRMLSDFGAPESAPGEPQRSGTFRGWAEHRSRIPNIGPTVRAVWSVAGALDSLKQGKVSEAQARLALYLCQLDQVSVDRGQWVLAAEGSLEDPPPFSSFGKHSPPDLLEPQHTRLWPTAWAEAFMYKVKELDEFVERRQKLGKRSSAPIQAAPEEPGKKGAGKKGNPKAKQKPAPAEETNPNHAN